LDVDGSMHDAASDSADGTSEAEPAGDAMEESPAHCGGDFECVPAVPSGWTGPLELYLGASAAPSCPAVATDVFDGMDGLNAPAATCGCACGSPEITCSVEMNTYDVSPCATSCASTAIVSGTCFTTAKCAGSSGLTAYQTLTVENSDGKCAPQATTTSTPPSWSDYARACAPLVMPGQLDCPTGQVCTRKPVEAQFEAGVCIMQSGNQTCPTGYGVSHVEYTDVDDGRGCSACTCGDPPSITCSATLEGYMTTNGTCSAGAITYTPPVACVPTSDMADMQVVVTSSSGQCAASAVSATGTATPTAPSTLCCTQ
jgi:hypothetical protein